MGGERPETRKVESPQDDAPQLPNRDAEGRVGRRRIVVTGLTVPVVLTLGSRSAQAQSGGSSMGSVTATAKTKKK